MDFEILIEKHRLKSVSIFIEQKNGLLFSWDLRKIVSPN